jgi:hypothetical protein
MQRIRRGVQQIRPNQSLEPLRESRERAPSDNRDIQADWTLDHIRSSMGSCTRTALFRFTGTTGRSEKKVSTRRRLRPCLRSSINSVFIASRAKVLRHPLRNSRQRPREPHVLFLSTSRNRAGRPAAKAPLAMMRRSGSNQALQLTAIRTAFTLSDA